MKRSDSNSARREFRAVLTCLVCFAGCDRSNAVEPPAAWEFTFDGYVGDAQADAESVIFGASDGNVYALESGSGVTLWKEAVNLNAFSRPTLHKSMVYIAGNTGVPFKPDSYGPAEVLAMRRVDGELLWRFEMDGSFQAQVHAHGDRVVSSVGSHVYCLDAETGALRWDYKHRSGLVVGVVQDDRLVIVQGADGRLLAFGADDGVEAWNASAETKVFFRPALAHGLVYTGNLAGELLGFDVANGQIVWRLKTEGGLEGRCAVVGDTLLFTNRNAEAFGVNAITGERRWQERYTVVGKNASQFGGLDAVGDRFAFSSVADGIRVVQVETGDDLLHIPTDSQMDFVTLSSTHLFHSPIGAGNLKAIALTP